MDSYKISHREKLRESLSKPIDKRMMVLLSGIERKPELYLGSEANIRCLFHFLNGWQLAAWESRDDGEAGLNEKMNAFLALKYNDFDALNWESLLIRHEGEEAAFSKFFEYFHLMDNPSTASSLAVCSRQEVDNAKP